MKHIQFLIDLFSLNLGLISIVSGIIIYKVSNKLEHLLRILVSFGFILIVGSFAFNHYLINISYPSLRTVGYFSNLGNIVLIVSMSFFANEVTKNRKRFYINKLFSLIALINIVLYLSPLNKRVGYQLLGIIHASSLGLSIIFISISFILYKYESLTKSIKRNKQLIGIVAILFLPLFIFIDFFGNYSITVVSLFFLLWSSCFIYEDLVGVIYINRESRIDNYIKDKGLTPREHETMLLLIQGYKYQEIGDKLYISKDTVKSHVKKIYSKCGVKNKIQLIRFIEG